MTFEQAVERVQDIMKDVKAETLGNIAVQVQFTNKDCQGVMYISTRDGVLDVQGYDYKDSDASIELLYGDLSKIWTASWFDWMGYNLSKILTGKLSGTTALERGTVVLSGNADAFLALAGCAKKPAAKKAAPKTETESEDAPAPKKRACRTRKTAAKKTTK